MIPVMSWDGVCGYMWIYVRQAAVFFGIGLILSLLVPILCFWKVFCVETRLDAAS